jgi:DNA-binding NarL/FixJ family response regulator
MKILVVDDHPMMADALRLALLTLEREADVVCVGDLASALAATASDAFDLALLDLGLPDCAGQDGLARLKERLPFPWCRIGTSDPEPSSALDLGAMGFIGKHLRARPQARLMRPAAFLFRSKPSRRVPVPAGLRRAMRRPRRFRGSRRRPPRARPL